jgi:hypothetical protein
MPRWMARRESSLNMMSFASARVTQRRAAARLRLGAAAKSAAGALAEDRLMLEVGEKAAPISRD